MDGKEKGNKKGNEKKVTNKRNVAKKMGVTNIKGMTKGSWKQKDERNGVGRKSSNNVEMIDEKDILYFFYSSLLKTTSFWPEK